MLTQVVSSVAHHLLGQSEWARTRLAVHAGKHVRIELASGPMSIEIAPDGHVRPAQTDRSPDLVIVVRPLAAATWLTDRKAAWREAQVEGDMELAAAISFIAANLRWDYEEDLSRIFGDVVAHRIGRGIRRFSAWPADAGESLARGVAEYLSEESQLLATPLRIEEFGKEIDDLRDAVERLEKRLDRLADRLAGSPSH